MSDPPTFPQPDLAKLREFLAGAISNVERELDLAGFPMSAADKDSMIPAAFGIPAADMNYLLAGNDDERAHQIATELEKPVRWWADHGPRFAKMLETMVLAQGEKTLRDEAAGDEESTMNEHTSPDEIFDTPFSSKERAQALFTGLRRALDDLPDAAIEYMFEMTPEELARADAGDDSVWIHRLTPEYDARLYVRVETNLKVRERRAAEDVGRAETLKRIASLMDEARVPDGMGIKEALAAGFLAEDEVARAIRGES